ncbi:MAG: hypothetical protein ACOX4A_04050 [Saccharofermentanales bacterium]|jgi:D-ornithine 4,5-aminomutase subunit beta
MNVELLIAEIGNTTTVVNTFAVEAGMDVGFGRGSRGIDVASFIVKRRREMRKERSDAC